MQVQKMIVALSILLTATAYASDWPAKPVSIIVPYPPGGNVDVAARLIAPGLAKAFGKPFIVENKAGAGGMIAGEYVAKAKPDGYTFFMAANGPLLYSPIIFNRDAYHWDRDFEAVTSISMTPMVLQVRPDLPVKTVSELIDYAKQHPGKLNMASPGAGTSNHLMSELLLARTGAKWMTVHYKGNAPAITDLLGGQVDFSFDQMSVALPYLKDGKLRPLAVTSQKRLASLPDVPTLSESGISDAVAYTFTGLMAPKGTPADILEKLSTATTAVLKDPAIIERFETLGAEAQSMTPEEFKAYLKSEDDRWVPIIKNANISVN
ncbi:Bug family tripartite tricarboxylate transporter substrate binding protein [Advenella mimigardefordensis]|uniref:Putative Bug-like extracytoplasmic solute binding receptor, TTT family n=1 Tax=Advenella mimigardefordensis (strain DSM 17166 / LMG 22922 / DPN7) TaxID=1247726 RepID=W0PI87_ADVMD|nr:tripartite tricarboxylate transporter substrate binding protein [Advenella mimigardefordensis]AHG65532.1 putative Bug-like extracytoplasmic solute binding receptor, TTT family [Advenella mimigardefordensis DPN7]